MTSYLSVVSATSADIEALGPQGLAVLFGQADIALTQFHRTGKNGFPASWGVTPVWEIVTLDSDSERESWRTASVAAARLAVALSGVNVNGVALGGTLAADVFRAMRDSHIYLEALATAARDHRHIVLWGNHLDPRFAHAVREAASSGIVELRDWLVCKAGVWTDSDAADLLDAKPLTPGPGGALARLRIPAPKLVLPPPDAAQEPPVLFCVTTDRAFHQRAAKPVFAELAKRNVPVWALLMNGIAAPFEISGTNVKRIAVPPGDRSETAVLNAQKVADFCKVELTRNKKIFSAEDFTAIGSYLASPHFISAVRERIGQAAALALIFQTRFRSVWLSSMSGPVERLVLSANGGKARAFFGFSASVSAHFRNLPLIDPSITCLAYGDQVEEIYRLRKVEPEGRVILTGGPHFDHLLGEDAASDGVALRAELGLAETQKLVLVMSARMVPDAEDRWLKRLAAWAKAHGSTVLIKPHPSRPAAYDQVLETLGPERDAVKVSASVAERAALAAADIVVSDASTSAILAAMMRKMVFQADLPDAPLDYNRLDAFGVSTLFHSEDELVSLLDAARTDGAPDATTFAAFIARFNWGGDGKAAERCAEILEQPPAAPQRYPLSAETLVLRTMFEGMHLPAAPPEEIEEPEDGED